MSLIDRLVLGTSRLAGGASEADAIALVREALDLGVRHIDTAPSYGMGTAEIVVGKALAAFGGPVSVTTKLGSARPAHAGLKTLLRQAKRLLRPDRGKAFARGGPAALEAPSGNDFTRAAMTASLALSQERLGRIDRLLLHDITASEADAEVLAALDGLASGASAEPGYASRSPLDPEIDARFSGMVAQVAVAPEWLLGAPVPGRAGPMVLHSLLGAAAEAGRRSPAFAEALQNSGPDDARRIATLLAWTAHITPGARLVFASSHRDRVHAVLSAVARQDDERAVAGFAAALPG